MSALKRLKPLVFQPSAPRHTATVIFLHGLGDSGYGWASAVENWRRRSKMNEVKFVLPSAPSIPITCNGGMSMPGWYDIYQLGGGVESIKKHQDEAGIMATRDYLRDLIQEEIEAGIPSDRIILGGFSQGAAMSLITGLTSKVKLAGIVAMSSYLPLDTKFAEYIKEYNLNQKTPILMCHGDKDKMVYTESGRLSYEFLKQEGYDVTFKIYPMAHDACLEELDEVAQFMGAHLPAKGAEGEKAEL